MQKPIKVALVSFFHFGLFLGYLFLGCFPASTFADSGVDRTIWEDGKWPDPQIEKPEEEINETDLVKAVGAGRPQRVDARVSIMKFLGQVKAGTMSPEAFLKALHTLDIPRGKEVRHVLMEVKKDVGRAYKFLIEELGDEARFDPLLK